MVILIKMIEYELTFKQLDFKLSKGIHIEVSRILKQELNI